MELSKGAAALSFSLLLAGCHSPLPLPTSSKLPPEKVAAIAATVDQRYPDLSRDDRATLVALVVRSLDDMVWIEGGEFEMGDFGWICDYDEANVCQWPCGVPRERMCRITMYGDDDYVHPVRLSSYHLSRYHTRLGDFDFHRRVLGLEPFDADLRRRDDLKSRFEPNKPAYTKTWQEAKDYCLWLGDLSGYPVDLPTEAQWEYAARNRGQYILYATDDGNMHPGRNYARNEEMEPLAVGSFPPSPLGLYDMSGNASEWVNDWYDKDYYRHSPVDNPQGPETGELRVMRGGNISEEGWSSANGVSRRPRSPSLPNYYPTVSFRCAMQRAEPLP